jgi:hypothetical protein
VDVFFLFVDMHLARLGWDSDGRDMLRASIIYERLQRTGRIALRHKKILERFSAAWCLLPLEF